MTLEEVLKSESKDKRYLCELNGATVRNNQGTLEFLNKNMFDDKEVWCIPYVNFMWVESNYKEIE